MTLADYWDTAPPPPPPPPPSIYISARQCISIPQNIRNVLQTQLQILGEIQPCAVALGRKRPRTVFNMLIRFKIF